MTGNTSPVGQVLGATTSGSASAAVLAKTGDPAFQAVAILVLVLSVALIVARLVKTTN